MEIIVGSTQYSQRKKGRDDYFHQMKFVLEVLSEVKEYDAELAKAKELSLKAYYADQKRVLKSLSIINPQLAAKNLERIEIPGEGNCQFEAVTKTAGLLISPAQLRLQACEYLK